VHAASSLRLETFSAAGLLLSSLRATELFDFAIQALLGVLSRV